MHQHWEGESCFPVQYVKYSRLNQHPFFQFAILLFSYVCIMGKAYIYCKICAKLICVQL